MVNCTGHQTGRLDVILEGVDDMYTAELIKCPCNEDGGLWHGWSMYLMGHVIDHTLFAHIWPVLSKLTVPTQ